jgi:ketosteroid isomerase-like protein
MSQENVDVVRRGYEYFAANGVLFGEIFATEFVWDMSTFSGWPERQTYEGVDGAMEFIADWSEAWEDWALELADLLDAGDRVVAVVRQRGRSKVTGMEVDMSFAQVWTVRQGLQTHMAMYVEVADALEAVGLSE